MNTPPRMSIHSAIVNSLRLQSKCVKNGFTLVEAVLALGIVSFAMMGILGMIPVGLSNFRSAMSLTVETTIAQNVADTMQRTDYTNLAATTIYFDGEGAQVAADGSTRIYTVIVPAPGPLDAGDLVNSSAAKVVAIKINNRAYPSVTNSYSVIVPRSN